MKEQQFLTNMKYKLLEISLDVCCLRIVQEIKYLSLILITYIFSYLGCIHFLCIVWLPIIKDTLWGVDTK